MVGNLRWAHGVLFGIAICLFGVVGCGKPQGGGAGQSTTSSTPQSQADLPAAAKSEAEKPKGEAKPDDVKAARVRLNELGSTAKYSPKEGDLLTEIVIQSGSNVKAEDLELFGKLTDLEKLQIFNCRSLNDEMAGKLSGLKNLKSLALTNTVINDSTVEMIVKSFPDLIELDLSSNTNMTNGVVKILSELGKLQRLTLVQNKINDIGAQRLAKMQSLRSLDLRGNMESGDMALEVISGLPKLTALKHRSTAVTDSGLEYLSRSQTLESLLIQDFVVTDQSGPHLAQLGKLSQLEIFRCQGFGSEGVLALKGMGLTRLTLRDLPNVDDRAMEVFDNLPKLKRLYLHELSSVGDSGLKHLSALQSLELLDIWTIPLMTDETVSVIATLPNVKELVIRATGVSDAAVDILLKMPTLQTLTFKENGSVTEEGLKKLASKSWTKLDVGASNAKETTVAP
jgi:hypothetical protein